MINNNYAEVECGSPPSVGNAVANVQKVVYKGAWLPGTEVNYTCDSGYVMAPEYYVGVVCGEDGNYEALTTDPDFTAGACLPGCSPFEKLLMSVLFTLFITTRYEELNTFFKV